MAGKSAQSLLSVAKDNVLEVDFSIAADEIARNAIVREVVLAV